MSAVSSIEFTQAGSHERIEAPEQLLEQTTRSWLDDQALVVVSGVDVRKFLPHIQCPAATARCRAA